MREDVRVNWFRMSALLAHWTEEMETLEEEMYRTVQSYTRDHERWEARAKGWSLSGRLGAAAYARRYLINFAGVSENVLKSL